MGTAPMATTATVSDSVDPLSGLSGPSLFPRTMRASVDGPIPDAFKDLDSIHNFMKSLKESRSPQKLMDEAKKIVNGGAELLASNLGTCTGTLSVTDVIAVKDKDKPRERRPGLGLARKRAQFSLKPIASQPSVNLEPTIDIGDFPDPDDYFDAYERTEYAKKEIQKQMGYSMDNINDHQPSKRERRRRPGLLGKSYHYKRPYSSTPAQNDDMWISSQETVYEDIPRALEDVSQEELVHPDPNADIEEDELAASIKKAESNVNGILEELLSCNHEALDGLGAMHLLQERFQIKDLDRENLCMSGLLDVGQTSISTASKSWQKSSVTIDNVLKSLSRKPHKEQKLEANAVNPVSSPTPPRSPFASLSLLKRNILQSIPLRDPFSALNIDISAHSNVSPAHPEDRLLGQVDAPKDVGISSKLESRVEVGDAEPPISNMDAQEVKGNPDRLPEQFVDENANTQRATADSSPNASPKQPSDELFGKVDVPMNLDMSRELLSHVEVTEPTTTNIHAHEVMRDAGCLPEKSVENTSVQNATISNMDAQEMMGNANSLPEQFVDVNANTQRTTANGSPNASPEQPNNELSGQVDASMNLGMSSELLSHFEVTEPTTSIDAHEVMTDAVSLPEKSVDENTSVQNSNVDSRPNEESDNNARQTMNLSGNKSNPSVLEEAKDDTSSRRQIDPEQLPEVHTAKPLGKRVACEKPIRNAHPKRKSPADESSSCVLEEDDRDDASSRQHSDREKLPEVQAVNFLGGKREAGIKRTRNIHPMRKSLADAGTTFENGVRRSKRIRMRPLEFWKGERFIYGRVDDSLKLLGVKYFSPGKSNVDLKVKPYIELEKPEHKEILDKEARL